MTLDSEAKPLTKEEREALTDYERGYIAALWEYGVWKNGSVVVGVMQVPIHRSVREFLEENRRGVK